MGWLSKIFNGDSEKKKAADQASPNNPAEQQATAAENGGAPAGGGEGEAENEGQEHAPVQKGYIETRQGKFGRKKVIETNLGPDGKPVYTGYQLEQAMQRMKEKKKAREQAKKEEKAYVEYRKAEVLRNFQPKVATLRLGDEAYPKRRRVGMGFGERKAHYLAIRPKPKFATWIGRKKGIIEAKAQPKAIEPSAAVVTDHSMLPDYSVRATHTKADDTKVDEKEEQSRKDHETKEKTEIDIDKHLAEAEKKEGEPTPSTKKAAPPPKEKKKEKKASSLPKKPEVKYYRNNKLAQNPCNSQGVPVWITTHDNEELTEDDLPVDMDILEKVCSGEKLLTQRPFNKIDFSPYGPIATMKQDDVLFVRDTILFANTVESVISLQPEDDKKKKIPPVFPSKLKWSDDVRVVMFHPLFRKEKKMETEWTEKFHLVARDKENLHKVASLCK